MAGGRQDPALVITITVENPQGEPSFVSAIDVQMDLPFKAGAVRYEFRDGQTEAKTTSLPINVPAFGMSAAVKVIAHFDQALFGDQGAYRARVAATGRQGFHKRYTRFEGTWDWRG